MTSATASERPLSFCMVTTFYPPYHFGGDGVYVHRLAEALAQRGHAVEVVHSIDAYRLGSGAEPSVPFVHHPRVTVHGLRSSFPRLATLAAHQLGTPSTYASALRAILAPGRFDVVHFHNVSLIGGPGVLRLGDGVKLYTAHEYWLVCPTHVLFKFDREACTERSCLACTLRSRRPPQPWRATGLLRRSLSQLDCLLLPSRFSLEQHRKQGIETRMECLPCFVPEVSGPRADEPAPPRPYFLYVGRLEKLKGVQDLVELFSTYAEADLVIVGTGGMEEELRRRAHGLPHVRFLGALHPRELPPLYRGALAVVAPSLCYETFGLTVAEAFAAGTPAIVRDIGALAEIAAQSGGGVAFRTLAECRDAMERMRTDPAWRAALAARGHEAARRLYSEEAHLQRYLSLVSELRASGRVAAPVPVLS